jgi:hypothetical protein
MCGNNPSTLGVPIAITPSFETEIIQQIPHNAIIINNNTNYKRQTVLLHDVMWMNSLDLKKVKEVYLIHCQITN